MEKMTQVEQPFADACTHRTEAPLHGSASRGRTQAPNTSVSRCRLCGGQLHPFVDLGPSPLCEGFLRTQDLNHGETFYPLDVRVCGSCWLAQLEEYVTPGEIFQDYAYFSSFSDAWLTHARNYTAMASSRFGLDHRSRVVEIGSNDGYLLRNFVESGVPCLGIEPAANVAAAARSIGVPTSVVFFDRAVARQIADRDQLADLVIANNVMAQVPSLNEFIAGLRTIMNPSGVLTVEVPHLLRLIEDNQFDTIYHEHFSYFSLFALEHAFRSHGLRVFDIEELWTHGGSLRLFVCPIEASRPDSAAVGQVRALEISGGLQDLGTYRAFQRRIQRTKHQLLELLIGLKARSAKIVGYGAPGKGNTLLNYCGIRTDFLDFTVDRNPHKHGRFLPGTRIPILPPEQIELARPDYVLILPWNLKAEIMQQLQGIRAWGGKFIIPIPEPTIL